MAHPIEGLQERIGYRFRDGSYLEHAVTHASYANETLEKHHHLRSNERLEFLGDAVLSILTSEYLFLRYPTYPEGDLTKLRAALVCEEALSSFAAEIGLGEFLLLGKGEAANGGAGKPAILADAFEALIGAVYLDAAEEGKAAVRAFLTPFLETRVQKLPMGGADCKSLLQVFLQKDGSVRPDYRVVSETGPDHAKTFSVEVYLDSNRIGCGSGTTKRQAEQEAAADALRLFGVEC